MNTACRVEIETNAYYDRMDAREREAAAFAAEETAAREELIEAATHRLLASSKHYFESVSEEGMHEFHPVWTRRTLGMSREQRVAASIERDRIDEAHAQACLAAYRAGDLLLLGMLVGKQLDAHTRYMAELEADQ